MASALGGVKYTVAQAFVPNAPRASTSAPTSTSAAPTSPLAPPGKVFLFPSPLDPANCQMNMASSICAARNDTPASIMVSSLWLSIRCPWVETSAGGSQVCITTGIAEAIAITMIVTARNLPIALHLCPLKGQSTALGALALHHRPLEKNYQALHQ